MTGNAYNQCNTLYVIVPENQDLTELVATFRLNTDIKVEVNGIEQVSGKTKNNFSKPN